MILKLSDEELRDLKERRIRYTWFMYLFKRYLMEQPGDFDYEFYSEMEEVIAKRYRFAENSILRIRAEDLDINK